MFLSPIGPPVNVSPLALVLFGKATTSEGVQVHTSQGYSGGCPLHCHHAWDIAMPVGTPVIASHGGRVIESGDTGGSCGITVVVESGYGRRTRYCHLSGVAVQVGNIVRKGDVVAYSGNTGTSTGPHLHEQSCSGGVSCTLSDPRVTLALSEAAGWAALLIGLAAVTYALRRAL